MHAVGDVRDRDVLGGDAGEERREHLPRDDPVQAADPVHPRGHANPEGRHVEDARIAARLGTEREQPLEREPGGHAALTEVPLHEVAREAVDARRHRSVRREHRARAHDLERMLGVHAILHQHAHPLHRE